MNCFQNENSAQDRSPTVMKEKLQLNATTAAFNELRYC